MDTEEEEIGATACPKRSDVDDCSDKGGGGGGEYEGYSIGGEN